MAIKKEVEIQVDTTQALKDIKELYGEQIKLQKKSIDGQEDLNKEVKGLGESAKNGEKGLKSLSNGFKGVGLAVKALGIGLLLEAFALLKDLLSKNQKVADFFSTTFEGLSIAFNDFINFIFNNAGGVIDFFKSIFQNPLESVKKLGDLIKDNLIERFNSLLEVAGFLGDAIGKLFEGDFTGAFESVKKAGVESLDVLTGVDNVLEKTTDTINGVVDSVVKYTKETYNQAKANVELKNSALLAAAEQARLVEVYDRQAEKQRQIRDDESKSIEERKKANEELGRILEKQQEAMIKQAELQVAAAQANKNTNDTIENQVALTEALANKEGVLAQIEGFRSEQIVNRIALEKEAIELNNSLSDAEKERQIAKLNFDAENSDSDTRKLELLREALLQEQTLIDEDIERKREQFKEGTQARIDAEIEYANRKQEIENELTLNNKEQNKLREADDKALADAKKANLDKTANVLENFSAIAGEQTAVGKGLAAASATINTYRGVSDALAAKTVTPFETALKFANAAAIGVSGLQNVSKIINTKIPKVKGASSGGGESSAPSAPSFNLVAGSGTNQIAEGISNQDQPIQAFVVSSEVTSSQSLDRNIEDDASI